MCYVKKWLEISILPQFPFQLFGIVERFLEIIDQETVYYMSSYLSVLNEKKLLTLKRYINNTKSFLLSTERIMTENLKFISISKNLYRFENFRLSLKTLNLGLKGELTITPSMEALGNSLFLNQVAETWAKKAYPSMAGLSAW